MIGTLNPANIGKEVTINGWVRTIRSQKTFSFIEVNDGSTLAGLQIVADAGKVPGYQEAIAQITTGAAVGVVGVIKESPGKGQAYEVRRPFKYTCHAHWIIPLHGSFGGGGAGRDCGPLM